MPTLSSDIEAYHLFQLKDHGNPLLDFHSVEYLEPNITPTMRAIVVDWLEELNAQCDFGIETLFLTVNILDKYLSKYKVTKHDLQLLGACCFLIAAKYEEDHPPSIRCLVYVSCGAFTYTDVRYCNYH